MLRALCVSAVAAGQLHGHWPSSVEITAAMLERYNKKPNGAEPKS
jgi:hypothetical protein